MTNATVNLPKTEKHFTRTSVTLAEHRIEYTGLSASEARQAAAAARKLGRSVGTIKARVTGSSPTDPHPFHYTVISNAR